MNVGKHAKLYFTRTPRDSEMPRRAEYSFAPFLLVFCVKSKPEPVAHGEHTRMEVYG